MKVIVQQLNGKLFLRETGKWTASRAEAKTFRTALDAIAFCIHCKTRDVRLIGKGEKREDVYLYPFGGDPVARAELKRLRRAMAENKRLERKHRTVHAQIDAVLAEAKDAKKQIRFKPQPPNHETPSHGRP